jgi:hypothetical protein
MFTHKQQSAWEALFASLLDAGFVITATWPVRTEGWHSLHIAAKNAAESTVLLVARKRPAGASIGYFDQAMRERIRAVARATAQRLRADGLNAVDQLVGSFGPAMEVFSRHAEVRHDTGERVEVGEAIDEASDAVVAWRVDELMARGTGADLAGVEDLGRYVVLWWDVLAAARSRFNEIKLLGHAVGLSPDELLKAGIAEKVKSSKANLQITQVKGRRRAAPLPAGETPTQAEMREVHPNDAEFRTALDAVHALALAYFDAGGGLAGIGAARGLSNRHGWREGSPVARLMQALVLAAPRGVQVAGKGIADEYPEFLAWHTLLEPLYGVQPPDWSESEPTEQEFPELSKLLGERGEGGQPEEDEGAEGEDGEEGDQDEEEE